MPDTSDPSTADLAKRVEATIDTVYSQGGFQIVGRDRPLGGVISHDEGVVLRDAVVRCGAKRTLETGMGSGISGLFICWGLLQNGGGRHVAIDPYQKGYDWEGLGLELRDHAGLTDMFDWRCEPSELALPRLVADGEKFDLAFIDGNHRVEGAMLDFVYIDRLLPVGGVCIFDDADWPSVRRVVNFAERHRNYERLGGSAIELPLTRPWGWRNRLSRRRRFRQFGWPVREANKPPLFESVVLRKTSEDERQWRFWASLE